MKKDFTSINCDDYKVSFSQRGYQDLKNQLQKNYSKVFILVDTNTKKFCLPHFFKKVQSLADKTVLTIKAGESNKHLETCREVWQKLSNMGADRKSLLINLGGGVVSDLGGFVAAAFKRGIDFINIPTTLLSMVDASIGGKTGVDLGGLKNQIGIITNPELVVVDSLFLKTLPDNEYRSGYAEMLKHGIIQDSKYFNNLVKYRSLEENNIIPYIHNSVSIKNDVVKQDPYEYNFRKILNFGHTLGHAIETHFLIKTKKSLLHGEAIAIGMITEAYISSQLTGLRLEVAEEIKTVFLSIFPKISFSVEDISEIISLLKYDKKNSHGKVKFVLLKEISEPVIDVEVAEEYFTGAFEFYKT